MFDFNILIHDCIIEIKYVDSFCIYNLINFLYYFLTQFEFPCLCVFTLKFMITLYKNVTQFRFYMFHQNTYVYSFIFYV